MVVLGTMSYSCSLSRCAMAAMKLLPLHLAVANLDISHVKLLLKCMERCKNV